jgi:hypothetical protein
MGAVVERGNAGHDIGYAQMARGQEQVLASSYLNEELTFSRGKNAYDDLLGRQAVREGIERRDEHDPGPGSKHDSFYRRQADAKPGEAPRTRIDRPARNVGRLPADALKESVHHRQERFAVRVGDTPSVLRKELSAVEERHGAKR